MGELHSADIGMVYCARKRMRPSGHNEPNYLQRAETKVVHGIFCKMVTIMK